MYEHPLDGRESFDGLHAMASEVKYQEALSGAILLFVNRSQSMMKILFWDRRGSVRLGSAENVED